jgi:hypothetical protein
MRCLLLAASLLLWQKPATLALEIRTFVGAEEVTGETRISIHRAGERSEPIARAHAQDGRHVFHVAPGIYDAQVVRERDGRVVNIRWAERLVVMPYPDEDGRHLEVVNFTNGYGALQVRSPRGDPMPEIGIYAAGERSRPATTRVAGGSGEYALFVLPVGRYDIQVRSATRPTWHTDIEVPLDRTRLWLIP